MPTPSKANLVFALSGQALTSRLLRAMPVLLSHLHHSTLPGGEKEELQALWSHWLSLPLRVWQLQLQRMRRRESFC